jgi:hypothetical protein
MTAKAQGVAYADFIKQGWTDALLLEHGYIEALPNTQQPDGPPSDTPPWAK